MKLSGKLLLVELLFLGILMAGVSTLIYFVVLPSVEKIEYTDRVDDIERIKNKLNNEIDKLSQTAADWAIWDDTYEYTVSHSKTYESTNLTESALSQLDMSMLMIIDQDGLILWHQHTHSSDAPAMEYFIAGSRIDKNHPIFVNAANKKGGLFHIGNASMLMAWNPILDSHGQGPTRGYLFFGKQINQAFVETLSDQLRLNIRLAQETTTNPETTLVSFLSDNKVQATGFMPFQDDETTVLKITIDQMRPFYQQAINATLASLGAILVIGLLSCSVSYFALSRLIISPIRNLQRQAETFGHDSRYINFQPFNRDDELGQLSSSFIRMAKSIALHRWTLEQERDDFQLASFTDTLTQLHNRRYLEYFVQHAATEQAKDWIFLMIDLDHFKQINDVHGHDVGDRALRQFASILQTSCRAQDLIVRSGGEEFMIICRNTPIDTGKKIAERIRAEVEHNFSTGVSPLQLTCSIGLFSIHSSQNQDLYQRWKEMIKVADIALYAAKNSGRNLWISLHYQDKKSDDCDHYPDTVLLIKQWIAEDRLSVSSSNPNLQEIQWQEVEALKQRRAS